MSPQSASSGRSAAACCEIPKDVAEREEQEALAFFGIKQFNSEKFENSDEDSVMVRTPVKSKGVDSAMSAFYRAISVEDALPQCEKDRRAFLNQ